MKTLKTHSQTNEVVPNNKPTRRYFSADDKLRILKEADACPPGELGALLRKEGIYASLLQEWRDLLQKAQREAFSPQKRGRKPVNDHKDDLILQLKRDNAALQARADQAEAIVDLQKKISEILKPTLPQKDERRSFKK
jgi:transposase-like protein